MSLKAQITTGAPVTTGTTRILLPPPEKMPVAPRMTPNQYKAAIKALCLSQERAGVWLGIAPRTSQGYALGEYPVPEPVAKLLRLMIRLKLTPEEVG